MHEQRMLNIAATFAPLVLSVGSVLFMARAYARRVSRCFALWTIIVWCVCELSLGLSLLLFLHTHSTTVVQSFVISLLLTLWFVTSLMFFLNALSVAVMTSFINFAVHLVFAGIISGKAAVVLALLSTVWAGWVFLFCLSFVFYLRRKSMVRLSDAVMNKMRSKA